MSLDKEFVKLVSVVNEKEDIERPHYNYVIGGQEYSLVMQENIDSEEYRVGLTKEILKSLEENQDIVNLIQSKKDCKNIFREDIDSFRKIRNFIVDIQENYNEQHIEKAMAEKHGVCDNLVDVVSVNFDRNRVMLRLNYQRDNVIYRGILCDIDIVNVYVSEQKDKQEALAEYLEVFSREYGKNSLLLKSVKIFQKENFLQYVNQIDILANKTLLAQIRDFATIVAYRTNGIIRAKKFAKETNINRLSNEKDDIEKKMKNLLDFQKERDSRFFGLGKYYDRFINTDEYNLREEEYKSLKDRKLACDREIDVISLPSKEKKRFLIEIKKRL